MVSFRPISVADVTAKTRAVATPLAADNQWIPTDLMRVHTSKRFSFFAPSTWRKQNQNSLETRDVIARVEIARSFLDTAKVILNRAAIYNHPVFQSWLIDGTDEDRNALANLIEEENLIIFYVNETEPLQWPSFHIRRDNELKAAWSAFVERFTRFPGLKLAWDLSPSQEDELLKNQLTRPFAYKINSLTVGDMSLLMRDLQLPADRTKVKQLRTTLQKLNAFSGQHFDEHGAYPTRHQIYETFVTTNTSGTGDIVIDRNKPFSAELKQIIDLAYITNLADALKVFSTSPHNSLNRSALQELQSYIKSGEPDFDPHDFVRILKNIIFESMREVVPFSGLGFLTPSSIYKIRKCQAYADYISALEKFVDATPESLGNLFGASETQALQVLINQRKALAREITASAAAQATQSYVENAILILQSAGVTIKVTLNLPPFKVEIDGLAALKLAAPPSVKISVKLALGAMDAMWLHDFSSVYELVTYKTSEPYECLRTFVEQMSSDKRFFDVHESIDDEVNEEANEQSADKPRVEI